jgi:hypothetical protein
MESSKYYNRILILILIFALILFFLFSGKCPTICKKKESFTDTNSGLIVIGVNNGGASGITSSGSLNGDIYYADTNITSTPNWTQIPGKCTSIYHSNGKTFALTENDDIYYTANYKSANWILIPGKLAHLSFDGYNMIIVGVNKGGTIYYANQNITSNPNWTEISNGTPLQPIIEARGIGITSVSYSNKQVYAVAYLSGKIYYNPDYTSKRWVDITDKSPNKLRLSQINFDGYNMIIIARDFNGFIHYATQNITSNPVWIKIETPGRFRMVSYSNKQLYAINNSGNIYYSSDYKSGNWIEVTQPTVGPALRNISFEDSNLSSNNGCNPGDKIINNLCASACPAGTAEDGTSCISPIVWNTCATRAWWGGCIGGTTGGEITQRRTYTPQSVTPASISLSKLQDMFNTAGCTNQLKEENVKWWRERANLNDIQNDMNAYGSLTKNCSGNDGQHEFCIPGKCKAPPSISSVPNSSVPNSSVPSTSSAPPYDNNRIYQIGDLVSKDGQTYKMIDGIGVAGYPPPRPTNWQPVDFTASVPDLIKYTPINPPPPIVSPPIIVPPSTSVINNSCKSGDNLVNGLCTTPCETGWVDNGITCTMSKPKTTYTPVVSVPVVSSTSSVPPYDDNKIYNIGDVVTKDGQTYKMIDGIGAPGYPPPRPTNWLKI